MSTVHVSFASPTRGLDIRFEAPLESTTAMIGPNGAGKSTTLEVVSGTLRPATGRVSVGERTLLDVPAGIFVPAHQRGIVHLTQRAALFPTMSVRANVEFGLRARGVPRAEARQRALDMLAAVGAADLADRDPAQLSGGQAQRVAIARALVIDPAVLLLDEPCVALDRDSRASIRALLAELLADHTVVLVSHDAAEVRALADRVVVLDGGGVAAAGSLAEVAESAPTPFAARLLG